MFDRIDNLFEKYGYILDWVVVAFIILILNIPDFIVYQMGSTVENLFGSLRFSENLVLTAVLATAFFTHYFQIYIRLPKYLGYLVNRILVKCLIAIYLACEVVFFLIPTLLLYRTEINRSLPPGELRPTVFLPDVTSSMNSVETVLLIVNGLLTTLILGIMTARLFKSSRL